MNSQLLHCRVDIIELVENGPRERNGSQGYRHVRRFVIFIFFQKSICQLPIDSSDPSGSHNGVHRKRRACGPSALQLCPRSRHVRTPRISGKRSTKVCALPRSTWVTVSFISMALVLLLLLLLPLAVAVAIILAVSAAHVPAADAVFNKRLLGCALKLHVTQCKFKCVIHIGVKVRPHTCIARQDMPERRRYASCCPADEKTSARVV